MTSSAAAGNGWKSHGLYRGIASDANLVLIQVRRWTSLNRDIGKFQCLCRHPGPMPTNFYLTVPGGWTIPRIL